MYPGQCSPACKVSFSRCCLILMVQTQAQPKTSPLGGWDTSVSRVPAAHSLALGCRGSILMQMPVGFPPERLSCCEDKLETICKSKSIPAQCQVSLIASLSAFNCNELSGSARRGAKTLD